MCTWCLVACDISSYRVRLSVAPTDDVIVDISLDDDQLALFDSNNLEIPQLTFTADTTTPRDGTWDDWVTLTVNAANTVSGVRLPGTSITVLDMRANKQ